MKDNLKGINVGGVKVSIVTQLKNKPKSHSAEYAAFRLKQNVRNARLIGVENKEVFAVAFQAEFADRFGISVYVDGVSVSQEDGIKKLDNVLAENDWDEHGSFICTSHSEGDITYIDRFDQMNGDNRKLAFTFNPCKSVNLNLINDVNATSKIEVYVWKERPAKPKPRPTPKPQNYNTRSLSFDQSYVGAGAATNEAYGTGDDISNPEFLGMATLIHVPAGILEHLGNRFVTPKKTTRIGRVDTMDVVPEV